VEESGNDHAKEDGECSGELDMLAIISYDNISVYFSIFQLLDLPEN
jgi:hypothetical protein